MCTFLSVYSPKLSLSQIDRTLHRRVPCITPKHYSSTLHQWVKCITSMHYINGSCHYSLNALARLQTFAEQSTPNASAHEFHETCHSVTFYFMKIDYKRCCDTTTPESIHNKDESKRSSAFAFIFGVN